VVGFREAARHLHTASPPFNPTFAFAAALVCHCIFEGVSAPPHASGLT
jgi:hypothetical protein